MHVLARERGVAQIRPTVQVSVVERFVLKQRIQHRDVALSAHIAHALRIARVSSRARVRNTSVVDVMTKTRIHVPQGIPPSFGIAIRVTPPPPSCVPIQPIRRDDVAVQDVVIDERQRIEL